MWVFILLVSVCVCASLYSSSVQWPCRKQWEQRGLQPGEKREEEEERKSTAYLLREGKMQLSKVRYYIYKRISFSICCNPFTHPFSTIMSNLFSEYLLFSCGDDDAFFHILSITAYIIVLMIPQIQIHATFWVRLSQGVHQVVYHLQDMCSWTRHWKIAPDGCNFSIVAWCHHCSHLKHFE